MNWTKWVIDAKKSDDWFLYYSPIDDDMNVIEFTSTVLPNGVKVIGVVHDDGQEAVEDWFEINEERVIDELQI